MIVVFGKRGAGKDLLCTHFAIPHMLNGMEECFSSYNEVDYYNSLGYKFSKNYKHLVFSNYEINCSGTSIPNRRSYMCNPFRVGLYSGDYKTDLFPPGSLFVWTEVQRVLNSHMAGFYRNEVSAFFETSRHYGVDFIFNTQRPKLILPNVRELVDSFIKIKKLKHIKSLDGTVVGHIWYVIEWEDWADVEKYLNTKELINCREYEIKSDKCLFENYDSRFCRYMHLKGRKKQDFRVKEFPKMSTYEDVERYGDEFGLNVPEGFYKKKSEFKSRDEEEILL